MRETDIEEERYKVLNSGYIPQQIIFDREQVIYLLSFLKQLREGTSPFITPECPVHGSRKRAPFEHWCEVAAELDMRLTHTEEDSYFVEDFCCEQFTIPQIAKKRNKNNWEVRHRINRAIGYMSSGPVARWVPTKKRLGVTYKEWKRHYVK